MKSVRRFISKFTFTSSKCNNDVVSEVKRLTPLYQMTKYDRIIHDINDLSHKIEHVENERRILIKTTFYFASWTMFTGYLSTIDPSYINYTIFSAGCTATGVCFAIPDNSKNLRIEREALQKIRREL
ncbi:hypothetical protein D3C87_941690 [compost metagenome]